MARSRWIGGLWVAVAVALTACGDDPDTTADADAVADADADPDTVADAVPDADADPDTVADAVPDADADPDTVADAVPDADADADTAADADADTGPQPVENAFGTITGACGVLSDAITSQEPSFWRSTWTFDGDPFHPDDLDHEARLLFDSPNAGGSSKCSETFTMEHLDDCELADLYKTENQVVYTSEGSITDLVVLIDDLKVGVSVTRAYRGPITEYSVADATTLLTGKLEGINESSQNVSAADAWVKQILHVWTLRPDWADLVFEAWQQLDAELKADTIVVVTVEAGGTDFVTTDSCDD